MKNSNITINTLNQMKQKGEKISMLTAYDASFARLLDQTGVDILLVGDSLGNVIQGEKDTIPVTIDDMAYHTQCVAKGNRTKFIVTDMPFMSYATPLQALENATLLMQAGAMMVKMEGGLWLKETVQRLTERGVPVCGHLGLTPQSIHQLGGYKMQGKTSKDANRLLEDAMELEKAGAQLLILECVPDNLTAEITSNCTIPIIGIGAGPHCDGQVLVTYDILGISHGYIPIFSKNFLEDNGNIESAISAYVNAVKTGAFPQPRD